jgi:hypothetical protein
MKNYGLGSLSDFLGDRVVYRSLAPCDSRLPGLGEVRQTLGLPQGGIPRKTETEYARIVAAMLESARRLDAPEARIHSLVFLGDTRLNDGTAFQNLCRVGGWKGLAFIGSERDDGTPGEGEVDRTSLGDGLDLYLASRWRALDELEGLCADSHVPVDESLAVLVDLDKTALGARGRNASPIDEARVAAIRLTVSAFLGDSFDDEAFHSAYDTLNQPEYHSFTRDNQDYLAYISLILASGLIDLEQLISSVRIGGFSNFEEFIGWVDERTVELTPGLREIHDEIFGLVRAGDPTPFKKFRRNEYLETVRRMGSWPMSTPVATLLAQEILITAEAHRAALRFAGRGALLFGLSDKPDEASSPVPGLAAEGFHPIHRTLTHIVGE